MRTREPGDEANAHDTGEGSFASVQKFQELNTLVFIIIILTSIVAAFFHMQKSPLEQWFLDLL